MLSTTSTPETPRQVLSFRVSGHAQQQAILAALAEHDLPDVVALGTSDAHSWIVVLGCSTFAAQIRARQVVLAVDEHAIMSPRHRRWHRVRIDPAGSA